MSGSPRIFVAGHQGLVGSALVRRLADEGYPPPIVRTRAQLDLEDRRAVRDFMQRERPDVVLLAAAKVGGILANDTFPADFIAANLAIGLNVITAAYEVGVRRLINLGSSCIYPRKAPQPIREEYLLTGPLEPTNRAYAIAKIAALELCESYNRQYGTDFITLMPTNLYGPGDNFDPETSHVLPGLLRRFHEAKESGANEVVVWGTGTPRREFLYVDDLADACVFLMGAEAVPERLNVGVGKDITIAELAETIRGVVGFRGAIRFDPSKPDGTPRKLLDVSRLNALGWGPQVEFEEGLESTYDWFRSQEGAG
jgi:GDP-L-fucose synthase